MVMSSTSSNFNEILTLKSHSNWNCFFFYLLLLFTTSLPFSELFVLWYQTTDGLQIKPILFDHPSQFRAKYLIQVWLIQGRIHYLNNFYITWVEIFNLDDSITDSCCQMFTTDSFWIKLNRRFCWRISSYYNFILCEGVPFWFWIFVYHFDDHVVG